MTNVLQFPAPSPAIESNIGLTPMHILGGVRSLWTAGCVSTEAFFVAAQVCYLFATEGKPVVSMSWEDGKRRMVYTPDGEYFSGPLQTYSKDLFAAGLFDLHVCTGLLNGLDKKFFNQTGNPRQHFTQPHPMRRAVFWHDDTPIYFRMDGMSPKTHRDWVQKQIEKRFSGAVETLTLAAG